MLQDMLSVYESELQAQRKINATRTAAKKAALEVMRAAFPETGDNTKIGAYPELWAGVSNLLRFYYPVDVPNQPELVEISSEPTFMETMRRAAKTGFIPKGEYLAPYVNGKSAQVSSYMSFLRDEGWEITRIDYGYLCKRTETPEEKAARLRQEQAAQLKAQADQEAREIEERMNKLSAMYAQIEQLKRK